MQFYFSGCSCIQNFDTLRVTDKGLSSYPSEYQNEEYRQDYLQQTVRMDSYGLSNHGSLDNLNEIAVIEDDIKESEV